MLPREFMRRVEVFREQRKEDADREEARFYNMINAFGSVMLGKKWKWQMPRQQHDQHDLDERWRRALERHHRRRKKRAEA